MTIYIVTIKRNSRRPGSSARTRHHPSLHKSALQRLTTQDFPAEKHGLPIHVCDDKAQRQNSIATGADRFMKERKGDAKTVPVNDSFGIGQYK